MREGTRNSHYRPIGSACIHPSSVITTAPVPTNTALVIRLSLRLDACRHRARVGAGMQEDGQTWSARSAKRANNLSARAARAPAFSGPVCEPERRCDCRRLM